LKRKILYLKGRPNAHPLHRRLAESLGCDFDFIDAGERWQDQEKSSFSNVISWFRNAQYLTKKYHDYDVFLIDNLHFTPVIMNMFFAKPKKKLMVHLGSHTLFFMHSKIFSKINLWLHKKALQQYDVLLCEGDMAKQLAKGLLKEKLPPTYVTYLGLPAERSLALKAIIPDLKSSTIVIIANGPSSFRAYYKGLDVMIKAFALALMQLPNLQLKVLGNWTEGIIEQLKSGIVKEAGEQIDFIGQVSNIDSYLSEAGLCLHCTRGDAFPTSTLEVLTAGLPVIISEWTGTKEVVEMVDARLIVALNEQVIAGRIIWYYNLPLHQKQQISRSGKKVAENYTEAFAIDHYNKTFKEIYKDLGI
jgi:glycosyltransferase involved in cell wall biosynthesis